MYCFTVKKRTFENLFEENIMCRMCFELQEVVIGREKHFIVHEENYVRLLPFTMFDDFLFVETKDYDLLDFLTHLGRLIIIGDNYLLCKNFHCVK